MQLGRHSPSPQPLTHREGTALSELVNLTQQVQTLQGYQLAAPEDMMAALKYLLGGGYTGSINCSDNGAWQMWLQRPTTNTSQSALIGDWIVIENNAVARVVPAALFAAQYTSA